MSLITLLALVLTSLIILSAFFSSSEIAYISLSAYQVEQVRRGRSLLDRISSLLLKNNDLLLATILAGGTIANVGAGVVTSVLAIALWGEGSVGIASGLLTIIILVFGEITPKQIGRRHNVTIAKLTAPLLYFFYIILRPIVSMTSLLSYLINILTGSKPSSLFSLDHVLFLVKKGEEQGIVEDYEKHVVNNVFRLSDTSVVQIMTHRKDIFSLPCDLSIDDAIPRMIKEHFSRVLLYGKTTEDIVGIVILSEIYHKHITGSGQTPLKDMMHKPIFIPATFKVNEVINLFRKDSISLAVALDEYGGLAGIVSQQDILEAILGELYIEEDSQDPGIEEIQGGWRLAGDTPVHWLEDTIGEEVEHDKSVNTISGYLCEQLGRLPLTGELIHTPQGRFHIHEVRENRVFSVSFYAQRTEEDMIE
ncbi:MAG: hemolysin family protein [Spirochaetia bacterium]